MSVVFTLLLLASFVLYFVPSFIAYNRGVEPRLAIMLLNIFFGWTLFVWIALIIWAYQARRVY